MLGFKYIQVKRERIVRVTHHRTAATDAGNDTPAYCPEQTE